MGNYSPPESVSSPPTTLGQYQIIREIARSNDIVYEGYDPLMNRRVAIKELAMPSGATSQQQEERINRFKREAQAAGTLNHANIMTVYSFAEDAGRTFMAMEYLDGCTLRNEIDTKGSLPIDRAIEIASEVLEGLDHAHSKGVIHRDIKPDNIQILSNGQIKITDFGIARLTFQPNLTMDGQVFGTPSYMSPEQVVGKEIDQRSDLFSVGVVLYEMLTGQKPFAGDSVVSITYAIMNKEPDQPQQVPYPLWQVISRALDKTPAMRHATAAEMLQALRDSVQAINSGSMGIADPGMVQPIGIPYVQPQPLYNYPQPQAPQPQAPPIVYPYNPYGPQPQQHGQYPPAVQQTPYGTPMPVYYPPPPRQPLIKHETKVFIKKLVVTVLVIGTLFLVITFAAQAMVNAYSKANAEREDQRYVSMLQGLDKNLPLDQKIARVKEIREKLQSEQMKAQADRELAVLYEELGNRYMATGDLLMAEKVFQDAIQLYPDSSALASNLASLYTRAAKDPNQTNAQRTQLWKQAADEWSRASNREPDSQRRAEYRDAAAQAYYMFGAVIFQSGELERYYEARDALYLGLKHADKDSTRNTIEQLLSQMG